MSKPSTLALWILPALALVALALTASFAGAVVAARDSTGAPAAATPTGTAPAPNPFAGLKAAFT